MLNDAQKAVLKAAIQAETDPAFVQYRTEGSTGLMAQWFNEPSTTVVWRTSVSQDEIMQNGFDWTRVNNLGAGLARCWEWMFKNSSNSINPSKANVRAGIEEVWKGTAADLAVRASVYVHCKRFATKGEKLFATGVGTDASPAVMDFEGQITDQDVVRAIND